MASRCTECKKQCAPAPKWRNCAHLELVDTTESVGHWPHADHDHHLRHRMRVLMAAVDIVTSGNIRHDTSTVRLEETQSIQAKHETIIAIAHR